MTKQEAIEELKKLYPKTCKLINGSYRGGLDDHNSKGGIALDVAIKALEKQVPKAPCYSGDGYYNGEMVIDTWECPCCGKQYEVDYDDYKYCPNCGQCIDHSTLTEDD